MEVPEVGEVDTEGSEVISVLSSRGTGPPSTPAVLAAIENGVGYLLVLGDHRGSGNDLYRDCHEPE